MDTTAVLLTLGGLFLAGLVTDLIGRHTPLPRVTLLIVAGTVIGPSLLGLLPSAFSEQWFPLLTDIALVMVGFLLGENFTLDALRERGRTVLVLTAGEVLATAALVFFGMLLLGVSVEMALILAGIAPASAPAATTDVVGELGAQGELSRTLLSVVAIDDGVGLIVFSLCLAIAQAVAGATADGVLLHGTWEVGGALLVGTALGLPMAYLTGRIRPGEPTQAEALGMVLLCGGVANWLEVSYILAAVVMGAVVANFAYHHHRPFSAIEGIDWPFMILFFVLAGASLHLGSLADVGLLAGAYIGLRAAGLVAGNWAAGSLLQAPRAVRRWMGLALLPQAGVALGMMLLAAQRFPELESALLPIIIGSTVVFELVGPVVTRRVLVLGEAEAGAARGAGSGNGSER